MQSGSLSLVPISLVGHDVVEIITGDKSIVIKVGFEEHVVELVFREILSQLLGNLLEFHGCDLALSYQRITALLTSKDVQTLSISALLSLSLILAVASLKNSGNSIPPDWSSSSSAKIW